MQRWDSALFNYNGCHIEGTRAYPAPPIYLFLAMDIFPCLKFSMEEVLANCFFTYSGYIHLLYCRSYSGEFLWAEMITILWKVRKDFFSRLFFFSTFWNICFPRFETKRLTFHRCFKNLSRPGKTWERLIASGTFLVSLPPANWNASMSSLERYHQHSSSSSRAVLKGKVKLKCEEVFVLNPCKIARCFWTSLHSTEPQSNQQSSSKLES